MSVYALIPAAGSGTRMGPGRPKQFRTVAGEPILGRTLRALSACTEITSLTLAVTEDELAQVEREIFPFAGNTPVRAVVGGADRQESVWKALQSLGKIADDDLVLVHDGVRPFVTGDVIRAAIEAARQCGAATCGVPAKDTIKLVAPGGRIEETLERSRCYLTQTPQVFRYGVLLRAHKEALEKRAGRATDDAGLAERLGLEVRMTTGIYENIKITTPEDMAVAEMIAKRFSEKGSSNP